MNRYSKKIYNENIEFINFLYKAIKAENTKNKILGNTRHNYLLRISLVFIKDNHNVRITQYERKELWRIYKNYKDMKQKDFLNQIKLFIERHNKKQNDKHWLKINNEYNNKKVKTILSVIGNKNIREKCKDKIRESNIRNSSPSIETSKNYIYDIIKEMQIKIDNRIMIKKFYTTTDGKTSYFVDSYNFIVNCIVNKIVAEVYMEYFRLQKQIDYRK